MIGLPESVKILLFTEPTDMRKGFDGLCALVAAAGEDVYRGHCTCFCRADVIARRFSRSRRADLFCGTSDSSVGVFARCTG